MKYKEVEELECREIGNNKGVGSSDLLSDKEQLEWLWKNCRITYYPNFPTCQIEHSPHAKKDCRAFIENEMKKNTGR